LLLLDHGAYPFAQNHLTAALQQLYSPAIVAKMATFVMGAV
jgi:hypothetical protein